MKKTLFLIFFLLILSYLFSMQPPDNEGIVDLIIINNKIYCPVYNIKYGCVSTTTSGFRYNKLGIWEKVDFNDNLLDEFYKIDKYKFDYNIKKLKQNKVIKKDNELYRISEFKIEYSKDNGNTWQVDWEFSESRVDFLNHYYTATYQARLIGVYDIVFTPDNSGTVIAALGSEGLLVKKKNQTWEYHELDIVDVSPVYITDALLIFGSFTFNYFLFFFIISILYLIFNSIYFNIFINRINVKYNKILYNVVLYFMYAFFLLFFTFLSSIFIFFSDSFMFLIFYILSFLIIFILLLISFYPVKRLSKMKIDVSVFIKNKAIIAFITILYLITPLIPFYLWGLRVIPFHWMINIILLIFIPVYIITMIIFFKIKIKFSE